MSPPASALPDTPPPPKSALRMGALFKLRPSPPRWPAALRAALSMGLPVAAGWLAGDVPAGMLATIGAFTALYATDRPYQNRAAVVAWIAVAFSLVVSLGAWAQAEPWLVVPLVVMLSIAATFICNAFRIGPPGAYMFVLACAAGTALPAPHIAVWQIGLLVLAGGALSWILHMAGALFSPRGPEKAAVANAAKAVALFAEATGTAGQDNARHGAAFALHEAWAVLVSLQPPKPRPNGALARLRDLNRELHLLFATCINAAAQPREKLDAVAGRAREIGAAARSLRADRERTEPPQVPLGRPGLKGLLRENLNLRSPAMRSALRVGLAVAVSGVVGAAFSLEHAYWVMASAVLMLHQGLDWVRTLQRGLERMTGTLVGLCLAAAILTLHPTGLWLVATMMLLQYTIEVTVTRNYALAVVFITAIALLIASGGRPMADDSHLLWARGIDTLVGCLIALIVHALTAPRSPAASLRQEIAETLKVLQDVLRHIATGQVTTPAARRARSTLQHEVFVLVTSTETEMGGLSRQQDAAEDLWPTVVATQRLAYRTLAACWAIEQAAEQGKAGKPPLAQPELAATTDALAQLRTAVLSGRGPLTFNALPDFLSGEIQNVGKSLVAPTA
ncbi:MAG: FUSC family protein [Rhizobiales bacterium]|nr:FUSC family protein [Hyphomicrobiales bacterium]